MKLWTDYPVQRHTDIAIGMLLLGLVVTLVLMAVGSDSAAGVGVVLGGAVLGVLLRLRVRLADVPPDA